MKRQKPHTHQFAVVEDNGEIYATTVWETDAYKMARPIGIGRWKRVFRVTVHEELVVPKREPRARATLSAAEKRSHQLAPPSAASLSRQRREAGKELPRPRKEPQS